MDNLVRLLIFSVLPWATAPAQAQQAAGPPQQSHTFASWTPPGAGGEARRLPALEIRGSAPDRARHALIGGAIGTVAGLAVCTVISNLADDGGAGFSTCTWKGYLLTGAVGFGLGFAAGWWL